MCLCFFWFTRFFPFSILFGCASVCGEVNDRTLIVRSIQHILDIMIFFVFLRSLSRRSAKTMEHIMELMKLFSIQRRRRNIWNENIRKESFGIRFVNCDWSVYRTRFLAADTYDRVPKTETLRMTITCFPHVFGFTPNKSAMNKELLCVRQDMSEHERNNNNSCKLVEVKECANGTQIDHRNTNLHLYNIKPTHNI